MLAAIKPERGRQATERISVPRIRSPHTHTRASHLPVGVYPPPCPTHCNTIRRTRFIRTFPTYVPHMRLAGRPQNVGVPHRWRTRGTGASCIDFSWNSPHACLSPHSERVPSACMHSERVPSAGATRALPSSAAPPLPVEQVEQVEHLLLADDIRTCYAVRSFYAASGRHCSGV